MKLPFISTEKCTNTPTKPIRAHLPRYASLTINRGLSKMSKITLILIQILLLQNLLSGVKCQIYDQEHQVLLKLKQYWQDPPPIHHWNESSHCSWKEITCINNSITKLSLIKTNINGTIPPFVCDLKNLTALDFQYNNFAGPFPTGLYNCSNLRYLDLSQSYFSGPIPDDIHRLSGLQYLSLGANYFSGEIPTSIGRLQNLTNLQLYMNAFNGSFPEEITTLSKLEMLYISYNTGFLPSKFKSGFIRLKNLKNLQLREVNLMGELPESIGDMAALEYLDLAHNKLTGEIPSGLLMLKNMTFLYMFNNTLTGEIPQVIKAMKLNEFDVSVNNLSGKIPNDIGKLMNLSALILFENRLSGEVPEEIGRIPSLTDLRLFDNNLSGVLSPDFGKYSPLQGFEVGSNKFTGKLPENLCHGGKLLGVIVFDNNLDGELPESLGDCSSLRIIKVENNGFTGKVPVGLWTSPNLETLSLSNNFFSDKLPDKLSVSTLDIDNNRFYGEIPIQVNTWRNMVVFIASNNKLNGTIPRELTTLSSVTRILLDQNQFTGSLPSDIIEWKRLTSLNLASNQITGEIPDGIALLPVLNELDLSNNKFNGQIPSQIRQIPSLNLSSNKLTGKIPYQFENGAYSTSFLNNPGLCATTKDLNLAACSSSSGRMTKKSPRLLPLIFIVFAVFILALVLTVLFFKLYWKRKLQTNSKWKLTSFQRLSFTESKIISGLKENNVIGMGGSGKVYRVPVSRSQFVAVKKIWNNREDAEGKLEKEFLAEVEILSTIRHINIVKLMCCISSQKSKLLVYEYLENGSLYQWLHKKNQETVSSGSVILTWPQRLRIAIGAAKGLCYMHHDCSPSVIHRDIKSSNILLDSDFNTKIADFGLAKMLIKTGEAATMSAIAGSFGYLAPEYAHTIKVNEKIDVYSFGVILLELTTGREASRGDEHTCLAEWAWRNIQENKPIENMLDEEIKETLYLNEMSNVFKLGILCTSAPPTSRPDMKEVVEILLRSSQALVYRNKNNENEYVETPLLKNSRREQLLEKDDAIVASLV